VTPENNSNTHTHTYKKNTHRDKYVTRKDSVRQGKYLFFFSVHLTDLKISSIKHYAYNYVVGNIICRNVIYFLLTAQRSRVGAKLQLG
jgi:hypothetical protein